jgi:hypothetical protein
MRSILRSRTKVCEPHDWRVQAKVDVCLQYAKANATKNMKIHCVLYTNCADHLRGESVRSVRFSDDQQPCEESERLVRFSDEQPLSDELLSRLRLSRTKELKSRQVYDFTNEVSMPKRPSRFHNIPVKSSETSTWRQEKKRNPFDIFTTTSNSSFHSVGNLVHTEALYKLWKGLPTLTTSFSIPS